MMICVYKSNRKNLKAKAEWARIKRLMGIDESRRIQLSKDKKSSRRVE